ncbi:Glycerol kinase [Malassezia pachydermatis]
MDLPSGVSGQSETVFSLKEVIPTGHKRTVRHVSWSPSGEILATGSFDSTVGIWERIPDDMKDSSDPSEPEWDCTGTLEGHDSECKSVEFSYNGNLLASCSRDKSVWIWEVQPESDFECLGVMMEHTQDVKAVAWHPKEELLASASYDNTIKFYLDDPSEDWFCYSTLKGHTSTVWSLSFSPCGKYLASASDDLTIRIWRRYSADECENMGMESEGRIPGRAGDKWLELQRLEGQFTRSIYSLSWAMGDESDPMQAFGKLAAAGADGKIVVFYLGKDNDSDKFQVSVTAEMAQAHGASDINCVAWAPAKDGTTPPTMLASTGDDGEVLIWV